MPNPITRPTPVGEVTEYFDDPAEHGFEAEPIEPSVNPDDLGATGE